MKENTLIIDIRRPIDTVFWFTVDPRNTPAWIEGIVKEKSSQWPPKKGTIYSNTDQQGNSARYVCTNFEENRIFELHEINGKYHVRYTFEKKAKGTRLIYFEWMDKGPLRSPFQQQVLERLKLVLEK